MIPRWTFYPNQAVPYLGDTFYVSQIEHGIHDFDSGLNVTCVTLRSADKVTSIARLKPNWENAPTWAGWWAVDPNGWAHWFQEEPVLALTINYCGWIAKTVNGVQIGMELWAAEIEIPLGTDWREMKEERPK